jgi:hemoglobin
MSELLSGDDALNDPPETVYDLVGGRAFFVELVRRFYDGVDHDAVLRPMYPADADAYDEAKARLAAFLIQYWGGPSTYSAVRGHPRLRMRHAPFAVDAGAREVWLRHMLAALDAMGVPGPVHEAMTTYFVQGATHLINTE